MSGKDDDAEKSHEPSQKKLDDARKRGEIPRSSDLSVAASYGGLLLALLLAGSGMVLSLGNTLMTVIDQADRLVGFDLETDLRPIAGNLLHAIGAAVFQLFLIPMIVVLLAIAAQRGFTFAPTKIKPKLSKISLLQNAKNKYGRGGLFEFFKSFVKLVIYSLVLAIFLQMNFESIAGTILNSPGISMVFLAEMVVDFLTVVFIVALLIGGLDFLWQRQEHMRKNRMSFQELKDEHKEAEGDPHLKQMRRQKGQEIASRQMMGDVPKADVVVVNPTHYAVALSWSRQPGEAPICVAKGVDEIALKIREIAMENGVPIRQDPPTARAIYATVELGDEIATEHYRAVAAAIRFAEAMRKKAGKMQ